MRESLFQRARFSPSCIHWVRQPKMAQNVCWFGNCWRPWFNLVLILPRRTMHLLIRWKKEPCKVTTLCFVLKKRLLEESLSSNHNYLLLVPTGRLHVTTGESNDLWYNQLLHVQAFIYSVWTDGNTFTDRTVYYSRIDAESSESRRPARKMKKMKAESRES